MTPKVLHVCGLDKFIPPFIDLIEKNFCLGDHFFWLNGDHDRYPVKTNISAIYKVKRSKLGQLKGLFKLIYLLNVSFS